MLGFFCDKNILVAESEVLQVLGQACKYWEELKLYVSTKGNIKEEWKFYTSKAGWCKKLLLVSNKDERNIVFLYPNIEQFICVLVYGEKAVEAAKRNDLPKNVMDLIQAAKPYKEGRSFNIEIKTEQDFEILKQLIDIKIQN